MNLLNPLRQCELTILSLVQEIFDVFSSLIALPPPTTCTRIGHFGAKGEDLPGWEEWINGDAWKRISKKKEVEQEALYIIIVC